MSRTVPLIISFGIAIFFTPFYFLAAPTCENWFIALSLLAVVVLVLGVCFVRDEYDFLRGQWLRASFIFIFGFVVAHFQFYVDVLLGNIPPDFQLIFEDPSVSAKCLALSVIALALFCAGYSVRQKISPIGVRPITRVSSIFPLTIVCAVGVCMWLWSHGLDYIRGGYAMVSSNSEAASYVEMVVIGLLMAVPIIHARNLQAQKQRKTLLDFITSLGLYNVVVGIFCLLVASSGDRGPIFRLALCYFFAWMYSGGFKMSLWKTAAMALIAAAILTTLGVARNISRDYSFSERFFMAAQSEDEDKKVSSFSPYTVELAGTARVLNRGVSYVPEHHNYLCGRFQLAYICSIFPTGSRWVGLLGIMPERTFRYGASSRFLTWIRQGDNPSSGDGTTCVADFYVDGGILLVAIGMFAFGVFMRRVDISINSPQPLSLLMCSFAFAYVASSIYIPRSTVLFELKTAMQLFVFCWLYQRFLGHDISINAPNLNREFAMQNRQ